MFFPPWVASALFPMPGVAINNGFLGHANMAGAFAAMTVGQLKWFGHVIIWLTTLGFITQVQLAFMRRALGSII